MSDPAREPSGRPTGGRFAPRSRLDDELEAALEEWIARAPDPVGGFDEVVTDDAGTVRYLLDGQPHRIGGPAVIHIDGTEEWYFEGALHRDGDQPAVISSTGEREWRRFGQLHRDGDKPARVSPDGAAEYHRNGVRHRSGGEPAIIGIDGHTEWWVDGDRHRPAPYGPALIKADGSAEYWERGRRIS